MPYGSLSEVVMPCFGVWVLRWWVLVEIGAVSSTSVEGGATIQPNLIGPYRDRFVCRLLCCLWVAGCHVDIYGEFDSGSGRTLAACLTHASRTVMASLLV